MAFTGVTNARGPEAQPATCRSPIFSLTTTTGSNQAHAYFAHFFTNPSSVVWPRYNNKWKDDGAVVVAQLVERWLSMPEFPGWNPVIGKLIYRIYVFCQIFINEMMENTEFSL